MALTPEQIDRLIQQADGLAPKEGSIFRALAKLTESEVRKSDDALLQAALDALTCTGESDDPGHRCGHCDDYVDRNGQVRAALRARRNNRRQLMSERTCEIDGKIFDGIPRYEDAESRCQGCAGDDTSDVCIQLADCLTDNIIWIEAA